MVDGEQSALRWYLRKMASTEWATIVTSAAVGAVASAAVSGTVALLTGVLERRARRRELIFARALDLAKVRAETLMKIADSTGARLRLRDDITLAADYFKELEHLISTGELTEDFKQKEAASQRALDEEDQARAEADAIVQRALAKERLGAYGEEGCATSCPRKS